jgi:hypothetical protein
MRKFDISSQSTSLNEVQLYVEPATMKSEQSIVEMSKHQSQCRQTLHVHTAHHIRSKMPRPRSTPFPYLFRLDSHTLPPTKPSKDKPLLAYVQGKTSPKGKDRISILPT